MTPIADQAERDRALDPSRSFIVQAPAGSGKTELLVQRFLSLLGIARKPEEILAITFTRKAAAEMRARVLKENPGPDIAHRLRIETIDAFCASLTRQMPVLSKFGAQPDIVKDPSDLYHDAAFRTLASLENEVVRKTLQHLDNNVEVAAELIAAMLARRDQWLRRAGDPPTRKELEAALEAERSRLLARAMGLHPRASEEFAREVLTKEGTWRKRSKEAQGLSANEPLREALFALLSMPPPSYRDAQWAALETILGLLKLAAAQLKVVFAERGQADFTEVAQGAVRALGDPDGPTDLMLALDHRIQHVLVDEFQDTSLSQWELLERLTAGWQPGDGRTLFLVGDPMQSIYRFREAEVGLFLHARRAGLASVKLEPVTLRSNFRSQGKLVAWFNALFSRVLPEEEDETSGAVPYAHATPVRDALDGAAVTWNVFSERAEETGKTVELVKASKGRTAILVRNRNHLDAILPALRGAGIRYRAVEIEQLGERQVVQDLYALARALEHLGDRVAWLAILRAPWRGFTLEDLSVYFEGKSGRTIWEAMQEIPSLERMRKVLAPAIAHRERGSLRERVESAWLALGGPACVEDATDLEDVEIFLDALEELEEAGGFDPRALEEKLAKLWALPDVGAGEGAVEVMTIHKAKGLEFDTVIVPGLDRVQRPREKPLFDHKALPGARILLAPINPAGSDKEPIYQYVRGLNQAAEDIEAARLLYVAATRARERLHLLACAKTDAKGAPKTPDKRSLLAKLWFQAEQHFAASPRNGAGEAGGVAPAARAADLLYRLPADWQLPAPPEPVRWTAPTEIRDPDQQIEFSWAGETARHVGTVVHRWLQRIAEDELRGWDAPRVDSLRENFKRDLERRGVAPNEIETAAASVETALKNTLADDRGRWILGPHPEARSEYRIRTAERSHVIDRTFIDEKGERWIVDFKTSRHEGANPEAFLDAEQQRYAPQLDRYGAALGQVKKGLYFPLLRGWRSR